MRRMPVRSVWWWLACGILVAGCWVTRGEIRDKVRQTETADTADTGE